MNIAILGAGLAGLAAAWHLAQLSFLSPHIVVFDERGVAGGASGIAAGLLHPFAGAQARLNPFGVEGMLAARRLLAIAEKAQGTPVSSHTGLLRLALTEKQRTDFWQTSEAHKDVFWKEADAAQKEISALVSAPGIFISCAIEVQCAPYLQGLAKACAEKGVVFERKKIVSLNDVSEFDAIVVALGAATRTIPELSFLPLSTTKGQLLEIIWPQELPRLPFPVNSQAYLVRKENKTSCFLGATYERNFASAEPDREYAEKELLPKACALLPALKSCEVVACRAGLRASAPGHLPLCLQAKKKVWVLSGLGSKGLLYHALFGEKLARLIELSHLNGAP